MKKKPSFNDVRMRRAVSLLLDRHLLVDALYLGYAQPTVNILSVASPFYRDFPVVLMIWNLVLMRRLTRRGRLLIKCRCIW